MLVLIAYPYQLSQNAYNPRVCYHKTLTPNYRVCSNREKGKNSLPELPPQTRLPSIPHFYLSVQAYRTLPLRLLRALSFLAYWCFISGFSKFKIWIKLYAFRRHFMSSRFTGCAVKAVKFEFVLQSRRSFQHGGLRTNIDILWTHLSSPHLAKRWRKKHLWSTSTLAMLCTLDCHLPAVYQTSCATFALFFYEVQVHPDVLLPHAARP